METFSLKMGIWDKELKNSGPGLRITVCIVLELNEWHLKNMPLHIQSEGRRPCVMSTSVLCQHLCFVNICQVYGHKCNSSTSKSLAVFCMYFHHNMEKCNSKFCIVISMICVEVNQIHQKNRSPFWFSSSTKLGWGFRSFGIWQCALSVPDVAKERIVLNFKSWGIQNKCHSSLIPQPWRRRQH